MPKSLVIVESPAKAKTINKYLGRNYVVKASMGHVKDLPKSKLGVDLDKRFEPDFITIRGKSKVLKELKDAAKNAAFANTLIGVRQAVPRLDGRRRGGK